MKKILAVLLAAALLCTFAACGKTEPANTNETAQDVGVANPMRLSTQSDPGKEAEKQLNSMFGNERKQLESQSADLNKQAEELRKQAAALSENARNERAQKIQKKAQEIESKGAAYTQRLSRVQQEINSQMNEVLVAATSQWVIIDYNNLPLVHNSILNQIIALDKLLTIITLSCYNHIK